VVEPVSEIVEALCSIEKAGQVVRDLEGAGRFYSY
jgi:hypothetical protein